MNKWLEQFRLFELARWESEHEGHDVRFDGFAVRCMDCRCGRLGANFDVPALACEEGSKENPIPWQQKNTSLRLGEKA